MGERGPATMPTLSRRSKIAIGVGVAILVLLLVGPRIVGITTDWMWFSQVGFSSVYSRIVWTRVAMFLVAGIFVGLIVFAALAAAYRSRPVFVPASSGVDPLARYRTTVMTHLRWFSVAPAVIIGALAGLVAQSSWATLQLFWHGEQFGKKDPQFNLDISFYAFDLPFYRFLLNFFFVVVVVAFLGNLLTHYVFGGIRLGNGRTGGGLTVAARVQLGVLAGIFLLLKAVAYWFDRYSLLSSDRRGDIFTGGTNTDITTVLPSKLILMAIAIICAVAFFAGIVMRDLRIPAMATALMLLAALAIGVLWPAAVEQFSVKPNAAQKEREYIERNIAATRDAYGIGQDKVSYVPNWTSKPPNPATVNSDTATLSNIRILDPNVLSPVFTQRQRPKSFYGFPGQLAVDRYRVDGQLRDYIVAVRELDPTKYGDNQQNWINKHTVYTHGNGFIAAPANTVDEAAAAQTDNDRGGFPIFQVSDLSTYQTDKYKAEAPIKVKQPRIYFGELISKVNPDYAIVGSVGGDKEYDSDGKSYTYTGPGVSLGSWFSRFLYSVKYTERNILLSNAINENSKIIYNRDPRDRVKTVAPWLTVDSKTYPAVMADGSIKWIVDGYTTLDNYPYAQKTSLQEATTDAQDLTPGQSTRTQANRQIAYARNSVKATVDAYTGDVSLYQFDPNDPVLKTWMKVFPGSVKSRAEFDKQKDLSEHVRYPEDLFKIQRALLAKYHVSDPDTFFRSNDLWAVPADPTKDNPGKLKQPPYYFTAADPKSKEAAFQLTTVMSVYGENQKALAAYLTVASDPKDYGKITINTLPSDTQNVGPEQAQENMKNSTNLARDRTLIEGSTKVTYGNLLTLPVGDNGLLYVEPIYIESKTAGAALPKLYRILVYYTGPDGRARIGYDPTVAGALEQVGIDPDKVTVPGSTSPVEGDAAPPPSTPPTPAAGTPNANTPSAERDAAVKAIGSALETLRDAQAKGDFKAYGEALANLDKAVKNYESLGK